MARTRLTVLPASAVVAAVACCISALAGAETTAGYRLAGVISAGDGRIGFLELPQGGQVLIRVGSVVDGGKVTEFSDRRLRIAFPDHTIELALAGSGNAGPAPSLTRTAAASVSRASAGTAATREAHRHSHAFDNAVPPVETRSVPASTVRMLQVNGIAEAPHADAGRYVAEQVGPMLGLPDQSRLLSVNDTAVTSAAQAVTNLQVALKYGTAVLGVDTPDGPRRIYVTSQIGPGR